MSYYTPTLTLLTTSIKKISNYVTKDFSELNYLSMSIDNNCANFANNTLKFVENKIIEDISTIKPEYSFILSNGEVIENKDKSNYVVISNISGFNNFKKGIPFFTISIALIRDNQEFSGVVYQPFFDNMFMAEKNKGAYLNKRRLKSTYNQLENNKMLIATDNNCVLPNSLKNHNFFVSNCVSLELCYLTALKLDLCIYKNNVNYFKVLPALIVAQEAGYQVTHNKDKNIISNLVAGNEFVRSSVKI